MLGAGVEPESGRHPRFRREYHECQRHTLDAIRRWISYLPEKLDQPGEFFRSSDIRPRLDARPDQYFRRFSDRPGDGEPSVWSADRRELTHPCELLRAGQEFYRLYPGRPERPHESD